MRSHIPILTTIYFVILLLLTACGQNETPQPVTIAPLGAVPATTQRPGDAMTGYKTLINAAYISCGIPYSAYQQTAEAPAEEQLLSGRTGRNRELPYMLNAHHSLSGVELVSSNCLLCHAGYFDGKLIIGLGNEFLDFTNDPLPNAERLGSYINSAEEAVEWRKWAGRVAAVAPYIITDTVGMNPAINMTLALLAHRDPKTLAWSDQALLEPPSTEPLPVSVPPWWRMKKKHALFYNAEGRGDHARIMMLATTLCTDTLAEAKAINARAPHIRAYLASLEAPQYPYAIDKSLLEQGQSVFELTCSRCHGNYGENENYPNLVIALEEVGTDPELAKMSAGKESERFIRWFNTSFFGTKARIEPALGYIAPPLDGIWATAPYLHNGSIPSIAVLLNSRQRPKFWLYPEAPDDFNQLTLGWNYSELLYSKTGASNRQERKRIYDTTRKGYANTGHVYGDSLSEAQRMALLEYLKTL